MEARVQHNYETVSLQKVEECTRPFLLFKGGGVKCSISRFSVSAEGKNTLKFVLCDCYLRMEIIQYVVVYCLLGSSPATEIQTPGNYPEDDILHPQHGESLKTTIQYVTRTMLCAS
jgi:hypothetical protein